MTSNDQFWTEQYEFYLDGGPANWIAKMNMSSTKVEIIAINGVAHNMFSTSNVYAERKQLEEMNTVLKPKSN
jgi:hypothetical protein